jgi:hypothetical protein
MPEGPLADPIEEAGRVADAARKAGVNAKLLGGAGIHMHSPSAHRPPLKRKYGDLDFAIPKKDRKAALALFPALGYEANERFNLMNGDRRLYFYDGSNSRQVDVFVDIFKMSHVIDLRDRLGHEGPCASPSDLLVSKLQIFEVNRKDLIDVIALLLDHPIVAGGDDSIDPKYVARLASEDWGLYRTLELNIVKLRLTLDELDVDRDVVVNRLAELWDAIAASPKPLKWRLRAQVGDRMQWYELPEEVRSPYQAE